MKSKEKQQRSALQNDIFRVILEIQRVILEIQFLPPNVAKHALEDSLYDIKQQLEYFKFDCVEVLKARLASGKASLINSPR